MPRKYYTVDELPTMETEINDIKVYIEEVCDNLSANVLLSHLIDFSICRHNGVSTFHLELFYDAFVFNGLPETKNLRYRVLDIFWHTGPAFNHLIYPKENFRLKIENVLAKCCIDAIQSHDYVNRLSSPGWWKDLERNALLAFFIDADKKKKCKERRYEFEEAIQRYMKSHPDEESMLIRAKDDDFYTYDGFDLDLADTVFCGRIEKQTPKGVLISLNSKGAIVKGHTKFYPHIQNRRDFVQRLASLLARNSGIMPYIFQDIKKQEKDTFEAAIAKYSNPDLMTNPPLHLGWIETELHLYYYSGICPTSKYGNGLIRCLSGIPANVAHSYDQMAKYGVLGLFSFSVFSIIKYFIPEYPSRITTNAPYRTVKKQIESMFFLSLSGSKRQECAKAFYGVFTDYGLDGTSEVALRRIIRGRVHDGVLIHTKRASNLEGFKDGEMIQDACVVCVNSSFPQSESEICVHVDDAIPDEAINTIRLEMPSLLKTFIERFESLVQIKYMQHVSNCQKLLANRFHRWYDSKAEFIEIPKRKAFLLGFADENWDAGSFERLRSESMKVLKNIENWIDEKYSPDIECKRPEAKSGKKLVLKIRRTVYSIITQEKQTYLTQITNYERAKADLSLPENCNSRKYIYLLAALYTYTSVIANIGAEEHKEKDKVALQVIRQLYADNHSVKSVPDLFSEYISSRILLGKIIALRGERNTDTVGWFDPQKSFIYLHFGCYYEDFSDYCTRTCGTVYPGTKRDLEANLVLHGMIPAKNGSSPSRANRHECKIVVDPLGEGSQPKETVLKINLDRLMLSEGAIAALKAFAHPSRRRSPSKKETTA